jgi:putative intracellular protease/amidase
LLNENRIDPDGLPARLGIALSRSGDPGMSTLRTFPASLILAALVLAAGCRANEPGEGQAGTAGPATTSTATPTPAPESQGTPPPAAPDQTPPAESTAAPPGATPTDDLPKDRPLRAAILVVDGVYNTELAAPFDVFQHTVYHTQPGIRVFTVSPDGRPLTTFEGLKLTPDHSFANAPAADVLVVPSARGSMDKDLQNQPLIDWVRTTGSRARFVVSLCDGAFVLAKAGLLDSIPATTFPDDYERFQKMFPQLDLRINVSFVDAGKVITSQGGARSYEAALQLVDRLYGPEVAQGIGKGLLVSWPPDPKLTPRIVETPPAALPTATPPAPGG